MTKRIELFNEVMRLENDTSSRNYQDALLRRARVYAVQKKYDLALADYDGIDYVTTQCRYSESLYGERGDVKFALGDLHGAIADYSETTVYSARYNRGFAYEKLGETEKAVADYTVAIENAIEFKKRFPTWRRFASAVPREGCADPHLITLDELKEIRDRLLAEESF